MSALKPCPFCGGEAEMRQNGIGDDYVACKECGASTSDANCETERKAALRWNRRADGWRPIETAPRDGTPILVYIGDAPNGDCMCVFWAEAQTDALSHNWHRIDGTAYHRDLPRWWQPEPAPPEDGK